MWLPAALDRQLVFNAKASVLLNDFWNPSGRVNPSAGEEWARRTLVIVLCNGMPLDISFTFLLA